MSKSQSLEGQRNVDYAKALAREGVRRYLLPFGVSGKKTSYRRAIKNRVLEAPRLLVIQDSFIQTPAEHIFGIAPGDCLCVQTILSLAGDDLMASIDFLIEQHRPALLLVVVPATADQKAMRLAHKLIQRIVRKSRSVAKSIREQTMDVEGCIVDDKNKIVDFV